MVLIGGLRQCVALVKWIRQWGSLMVPSTRVQIIMSSAFTSLTDGSLISTDLIKAFTHFLFFFLFLFLINYKLHL